MKIPEKITIVNFIAFNQSHQMVLEDIDQEKVEPTIKRKTSETAIILNTVEYSGIKGKTSKTYNEWDMVSTLSEDYYKSAYRSLEADSVKRSQVK
jgi:hypothetical protein